MACEEFLLIHIFKWLVLLDFLIVATLKGILPISETAVNLNWAIGSSPEKYLWTERQRWNSGTPTVYWMQEWRDLFQSPGDTGKLQLKITVVTMLVLCTLLTLCSPQLLLNQECCMYPCVMLEGEEENYPISDKSWIPELISLLLYPCLSALSQNCHWKWHPGKMIPLSDFSCLVRLHRDHLAFTWVFMKLNNTGLNCMGSLTHR